MMIKNGAAISKYAMNAGCEKNCHGSHYVITNITFSVSSGHFSKKYQCIVLLQNK